jgi:hypothetical protein
MVLIRELVEQIGQENAENLIRKEVAADADLMGEGV